MTPPTPHITPRAAPRRVLEDASGRRLRRMRWVGRTVALLFLIWLAVVILGGLGVGPVARLPFGHVLRPTAGPPPLRHALHPRQAAPADLVPALPAPVAAPVATPSAAARATHGKSSLAPGRSTTTVATPGRSGSAPGQAKKTTTTVASPGKSASAPGHTKTTTTVTTTPGRSGSAQRKTTTVTTTTVPTTPGKSHVLGKKP